MYRFCCVVCCAGLCRTLPTRWHRESGKYNYINNNILYIYLYLCYCDGLATVLEYHGHFLYFLKKGGTSGTADKKSQLYSSK